MAMTQSEINALLNKINAGTYTLDDALEDIAEAAKGRDVRAAIYALAYLTGSGGNGSGNISDADLSKKVSLPVTDDGTADYGSAGQFAVSDGKGGVIWEEVVNADTVLFYADGNEVKY